MRITAFTVEVEGAFAEYLKVIVSPMCRDERLVAMSNDMEG